MTDDASTTDSPADSEFDITELEALSGVTRRTIRFYIQRGLVRAPHGTGRGKHYDREHLQRLIEVRSRQEAGESLDAIAALSATSSPDQTMPWPAPAVPPGVPPLPEAWLRLPVVPGLELHAQAGRLDVTTLRRIAQVVRSMLTPSNQGAPNDDRPEEP
ncbi:MAG: MerR family transcriptional regulator [Myxococcales bacterium]|nr:MerR family transcriptional regulator [Myxococcales bacterium]